MLSKLFKISLLILVFSLFSSEKAEARKSGFFSFGGEAITKVADFPDTEAFQMEDGSYVDAGAIYKQVTILFIPVWNYEIRWCGYVGEGESYMDLSKEQLDALAAEAGVTLPESPSISFWHSIGGKLVLLAIIGAFIAYSVLFPEEEEKPADENSTE